MLYFANRARAFSSCNLLFSAAVIADFGFIVVNGVFSFLASSLTDVVGATAGVVGGAVVCADDCACAGVLRKSVVDSFAQHLGSRTHVAGAVVPWVGAEGVLVDRDRLFVLSLFNTELALFMNFEKPPGFPPSPPDPPAAELLILIDGW